MDSLLFEPLRPQGRDKEMAKKIYVGNLTLDTTSEHLNQLFSKYGSVKSADVTIDPKTKSSRCFGYVEMSADEETQAAIDGLHEKEVNGNKIIVNEDRPFKEVGRGGAKFISGGRGGGYAGGRGGRGGRGGGGQAGGARGGGGGRRGDR
jgi:hypothetical protein